MKHLIGGFAFGVVFLETIVLFSRTQGAKVTMTFHTNIMWGICFGLAAWGLLP